MRGWLLSALLACAAMLVPVAVMAGESGAGERPSAAAMLKELEQAGLTNAYLPFARHALSEAAKGEQGRPIRSAVLAEPVSLVEPRSMACNGKALAAIIDLDIAPGTPAEMEIVPQSGLAYLLDSLRTAGIRIVWLAEADEGRLQPVLDLLREGDQPVIRDADLMLIGLPRKQRKQELRQQLARAYCIVAIAGDRKADFDELYDYLRDPGYAIRLEAYTDRGWFLLPHPVAAIDSERLQPSPQQKAKP